MIRTSKLSTKLINKQKLVKLKLFINQYKQVVEAYIDIIWDQLNIDYDCPKYISTKDYNDPILSQRAIKCASTQACGMVKASVEKVRRLKWVINKLREEGEDVTVLEDKLASLKIVKPTIPTQFKCELNSLCCDLKQRPQIWFLQLKSIGKSFGKIRIPLLPHRQTLKWLQQAEPLNSFLVSEIFVDIRFEISNEIKQEGKVVGLDQGVTSCVTLSDNQVSKQDTDGWDLTKILRRLARRKKGSKGFRRAQEQRKNYINWSINQLNLKDIKQINVEKIKYLRQGKSVGRLMSHWTYRAILDKLNRFCEEQKVFVKEQSCTYRSQRCHDCGLVRKSQRNGKLYSCVCGYINDADLNASLNHSIELPIVDFLRRLKLNIEGFYWKPEGLYDLNGNELTVRCT